MTDRRERLVEAHGYAVRLFQWDVLEISKVNPPIQYIHIGIAIFNRLYHFMPSGLTISYAMPENYQRVGKYQITKKAFRDFDNWCAHHKRHTYSNATFDMIKCNSIIFVRDACNFLGIEMDSAALDLQDLLETNEPQLRDILKKESRFYKQVNITALMLSFTSSSFLTNPPKTVDALDTVVELTRLDTEMQNEFNEINQNENIIYAIKNNGQIETKQNLDNSSPWKKVEQATT